MLIDLVAVDFIMIAASALNVMLRASRFEPARQCSDAMGNNSINTTDGILGGAAGANDVAPPPSQYDAAEAEQEVVEARRHSCLASWHMAADVLALISNSLTHLLRPSQVLFALFQTTCDALLLGRESCRGGRSKTVSHVVVRFRYLFGLVLFALALGGLHDHTIGFGFGDWCGYVGGLIQVFLLGTVLGSRRGPLLHVQTQQNDSPTMHHGGHASLYRRVVAEYALERIAGCVSSLCYILMLFEEGEAVYSSHREFIRWYGGTTAALLADALLTWRVLSGKYRLGIARSG